MQNKIVQQTAKSSGPGKFITFVWTLGTFALSYYAIHKRNQYRKKQKSFDQMPDILKQAGQGILNKFFPEQMNQLRRQRPIEDHVNQQNMIDALIGLAGINFGMYLMCMMKK